MPPPPYMTHTFPGTAVNDMRFCPFDDVLGVGHGSGFTSLIIPGAGEANFDSLEADPFEGKRRRREREVNSLLDKIPFDMITLDTEMVGKLDTNVMKAEERTNPDKPGFKATPYAQKTRLDRLKADGEHQEDEEEYSDDEEDEDEERRKAKKQARVEKADAKNRARGRNSTLKKMLRKRRRNVVDPQTVRFFAPTCLLNSALIPSLVLPSQVALKEKLERQRAATKIAKQNALAQKSAASGTAGALDRFGFK